MVNAGCNTMTGGVSLEAGTVVVKHLASTMMACEPGLTAQDAWLNEFLESGPKWSLVGEALTLDNGTTSIILERG
ncbi:META domain-containing protein [Antricoccus suffuscus]|uniref:META domain-containing protein n=1 Tax=Antricoccus suffuscus TaxID=1629062 RepID=A0A2T1A652_9ACTN|nr:META domain-containing protein [Antricoccus suffuscus]